MLALFDSACEVVFPPEVPEPGPFRGHAELRQWAEGFLAAWDFHESEVVEIVDAGDSVVAVLHQVGRGIGSGIEMDETDAHVFTIREGRIVRWQNFNELADALEAAGLSK
jgi:uncharacterized protein